MRLSSAFSVSMLLGPILFGLAAPSSQAAYEIRRGDTLAKIAISKYGNLEKWKEIFELNKAEIKNPHWIYPGQRLRLMPEESLTLVASNGPLPRIRKRSQEWRLLPQQRWERFVFRKDPYVDPTGFDRRSTIGERFADKTVPTLSIAPDRIPIQGEITGSRSNYSQLTLGETALIRADESIQVGTVYSVTDGPEKLSSSRDGRVGFAYSILGKIKIIGVRDGMFIGTITAIYYPIERGNLLIPEVNTIKFPNPMACSAPLHAIAMLPKFHQADLNGQQKLIFLDVGSADGVKPGMIFRHYLNTDPYTHSKFPTRDFMIESEVMALSVQDQFSIGVVIQSRSGIRHDEELVGLTDLKDFDLNQGLQSVLQDHAPSPNMDELDHLDNTDGLGDKETEELRQLETWSKQIPSEGTGAGLPEEEIKREVINSSQKSAPALGEETAPNDSSGTGIPQAPTTAPEQPVSESPAPEAPKEPTVVPKAEPTPAPKPTPKTGTENEVQPETTAPPPSIDSSLESAPITP